MSTANLQPLAEALADAEKESADREALAAEQAEREWEQSQRERTEALARVLRSLGIEHHPATSSTSVLYRGTTFRIGLAPGGDWLQVERLCERGQPTGGARIVRTRAELGDALRFGLPRCRPCEARARADR